ncbi:MAG: hypothetical protein ACRDGK_06845 [Actinomycetota bacterium]
MMRRFSAVSLVAAWLFLAAIPAEAVRTSELGARFDKERGLCRVTTRDEDAVVRCDLDEYTRIRYRFRLPRDAYHLGVGVRRGSGGCCGSVDIDSTRNGADRRHLIVQVRVGNYGSLFEAFSSTLHRVDVRYRRVW